MILTLEEMVELDLLPGWRELPPTSVLAADDWMWEWVESAEIDNHRRESFSAALTTASRFVQAVGSPERSWIVVSNPVCPPESVALAALSVVDERYVESAPEPLVPGVHVFASTRHRREVSGGTLSSLHEIIVAPYEGDYIVTERYVGWLHQAGQGLTVRLEIFARSVDSFSDVLTVGETALRGARVL